MVAGALPAAAQTGSTTGRWTERRYDPPVGSRWVILSDLISDESRPGAGDRHQRTRIRSELTIEEKLADGYRVSHVVREVDITGNTPTTAIARAAYDVMKNVRVRARTDAAGKPLAVENLDEMRTGMRRLMERLASSFDNPKVAALVRQMLTNLLDVEGEQAAAVYLEDIPALAAGQNTGLKPGEARREDDSVPGPLGGAMKSTLVTRLAAWNDDAGTARIVRRRETDPAALRDMVIDIARRLSAAASDKVTPEMIEMMKTVSFSVDSETIIDVRNGMTVNVDDRSKTVASAQGTTFTKTDRKVIAVTPMGN
jgi:hypothetical protein